MAAEQAPAETVTRESAIANAARLLRAAEMETNLMLMERLEKLADSWIVIAHTFPTAD